MKIAIDCHTLEVKNWAGKEQFLFSILEQLKKSNFRDKFILYFRQPVIKKAAFPDNFIIKNYLLPTPLWHFRVLIDLLFSGIDRLLCPCAYLLPALNIFIPQFIVAHDLTPFLSEIAGFHKLSLKIKEKLTFKLAIRNSKKVIAVSDCTKNDLVKDFKIDSNKIDVVPLAVSNRFKKISNVNSLNKIKYKYKLPDKFILFVGTLEPRKNIINIIKAHKLNAKENGISDYKLVIVGKNGWHYNDILKTVEETGLKNKVIFLGYVKDEDLPVIYNLAGCFVYPSFYEGFGLPPLEAMACGCPVITSNISSLPEVVGSAAVLIDPKNIDAIANSIKMVLIDKKLRQNMIADGLLRAQKFSWAKTANSILNIVMDKKYNFT